MDATKDLDAQSLHLFENTRGKKPAFHTEEERLKGEREGYRHVIAMAGVIEELYEIKDRLLAADFGAIPIRIYRPTGKSNLPVLVYFHGGGGVAGGLDTHDQQMRYLAKHAEVLVVAVAYSLAPERKFPAALNDALYSVKWVYENCASLNADGNRIAIGGDSAGGLISALAAWRLKNEKSMQLAFQLLYCPNLDLSMSSDSWKELGDKGYVITTERQAKYFEWLLPEHTDRRREEVSPLFASDFSGLPPTLVITASADPLKDEGRLYAEKLQQAGVPVTHKEYEGVMHGFYQLSGAIDKGKTALDESSAILKAALSPRG
jgi:acetyl esterase